MEENRVSETKSYCNKCQKETTFIKVIEKASPLNFTVITYKCLGCGTEHNVRYRER
jgi:RNase P subunit RPR2